MFLTKLHFSSLIAILIAVYYFYYYKLEYFTNDSFKMSSSVWCVKEARSQKLCRFKNVCYDTDFRSLLFFLHEKSVIKGIANYSDLQKIQLSSVFPHNNFYANLSVLDVQNHKIKKHITILPQIFLFSRFKPNNIMHVIHDDLFPLFLTLEHVCLGSKDCIKNYNLVIHDSHSPGPYFNFYASMSEQKLIKLSELPPNNMLCFNEMLTGFVQDSLFYQYGFNEPQGPIENFFINTNDVQRFTTFIKEKLKVKETPFKEADIVLLKRHKSRKILNIEEVKQMMENVYLRNFKKNYTNFLILDTSVNFSFLINVVSNCKILAGMHGAEMIFSIFLKPKSIVFELFPYAIQPEVVSFVKPISKIEGNFFHYYSWKNILKNNSFPHPDTHPLFGGINHLDTKLQEKIKSTVVVPPFPCCHDPNYLYHMYQDTLVSSDFEEFFQNSLLNCLNEQESKETRGFINKWFSPSIVSNFSCEFQLDKKYLIIDWFPPFNVVKTTQLEYNICIFSEEMHYRQEYITNSTNIKLKFFENVDVCIKFKVWIQVFYNENSSKSVDKHFVCNCTKNN